MPQYAFKLWQKYTLQCVKWDEGSGVHRGGVRIWSVHCVKFNKNLLLMMNHFFKNNENYMYASFTCNNGGHEIRETVVWIGWRNGKLLNVIKKKILARCGGARL